jgi:hypothetical protein
MPTHDSPLTPFATEYMFALKGQTLFITRRSNHGDLFDGGVWVVLWIKGSMNPWYLNRSAPGDWAYKAPDGFATADQAYAALCSAEHPWADNV